MGSGTCPAARRSVRSPGRGCAPPCRRQRRRGGPSEAMMWSPGPAREASRNWVRLAAMESSFLSLRSAALGAWERTQGLASLSMLTVVGTPLRRLLQGADGYVAGLVWGVPGESDLDADVADMDETCSPPDHVEVHHCTTAPSLYWQQQCCSSSRTQLSILAGVRCIASA